MRMISLKIPVLFFWNQLKLGAPTSRTDPIQVAITPMLITSKIGSLLFVACIVMQLASTLAAQNIQHDYCILGAGPGGLQVGHLMLKRGWDYITFERNARPGSFFETYPVHRQLISLNKRYTGRNSKEFNLRHDWNSLLDSDVLPVPNRTHDRFPSADVLVEYLRDFAVEQEAVKRIQYNTTVLRITRDADNNFVLSLKQAYSTYADDAGSAKREGKCTAPGEGGCDSTATVRCNVVVHAGGIWTTNKPQKLMDQGFDVATTYSELPPNGYEAFNDKKVAIFGLGNAAMESADRFAPHTAFVHTFPGRGKMKFPHFAYETRYVGNVRTWRSQIIDSYTLKSLDGGFPSFNGEGITVRRCGDDLEKKCLFTYDKKRHTVELAYQEEDEESLRIVQQLHTDGCVVEKLLADQEYGLIRSPGYGNARTKESLFHDLINTGVGEKPEKMFWPAPGLNHPYVTVNASCITEEVATRYSKLEGLGGMDPYPLVYDSIILCLGFRHDETLYGNTNSDTETVVNPIIQSNGRYPVLTDAYEAKGEPGLYFAGALAHGRDYRRAAGGFIHGFRYTARALVMILAERHRTDPVHWPTVDYPGIIVLPQSEGTANAGGEPAPTSPGIRALSTQLLKQINEGSAPYQMVHVIGDGVVFHCNGERTEMNATYFKEMPLSYFNQQYRGLPRLTTSFGYNGQTRKLEVSVTQGTQFKVFGWFYPGDCTHSWKGGSVDPEGVPGGAVEHRELLEFRETMSTQYSSYATLPILDAFILDKAKQLLSLKDGWAAPGPQPSAGLARDPEQKGLQDLEIREDDFAPGRIDVWVKNLSPSPISLYTKPASDTDEAYGKRMKWRKHKIAEAAERPVVAVIDPGDGLLIKTQHLDRWKAIDVTTRKEVSMMVVDLAKGIVQDFLVGYEEIQHRKELKKIFLDAKAV